MALNPSEFLRPLKRHLDARGSIMETCNAAGGEAWLDRRWTLDLESRSTTCGTLRGLHFQTGITAQAKIVRCSSGSVFDVIVDLREGSATLGQHLAFHLLADEPANLHVPRGFAHGFVTLEDDTTINYKLDAPYDPASAKGIFWNDPALAIEWPGVDHSLVSPADANFSNLADSPTYFRYVPGALDGEAVSS